MAKRKQSQREYSTIRVKQAKRKVVEKLRVTEYKALTGDTDEDKPQYVDPIEQIKHAAILAADVEAAHLCSKGHHLYGGARLRWIAGKTGCTLIEVKTILHK